MAKQKSLNTRAIHAFKYDPDLSSLSQRAAQLFDWAAKNYPFQFVPWHWAYMAVTGTKRVAIASKQVENFRKSAHTVRRILIDDYERELTTMRGVGARATVNDDDTARTEMVKKSRRLQGSIAAAKRTFDLIDNRKISDPTLKKWLSKSLKGAIKEISSTSFENKLLPPPEDEEE